MFVTGPGDGVTSRKENNCMAATGKSRSIVTWQFIARCTLVTCVCSLGGNWEGEARQFPVAIPHGVSQIDPQSIDPDPDVTRGAHSIFDADVSPALRSAPQDGQRRLANSIDTAFVLIVRRTASDAAMLRYDLPSRTQVVENLVRKDGRFHVCTVADDVKLTVSGEVADFDAEDARIRLVIEQENTSFRIELNTQLTLYFGRPTAIGGSGRASDETHVLFEVEARRYSSNDTK
jgi:hypothetical protein